MSKVWEPRDPEIIQYWIKSCVEAWKYLTNWERGFIEDIGPKYDQYGKLTEPQERALERIYATRTK